ncbi:MAG: glycerol-3-phosphate acyltransferase [Anaerolineae bacterium]|nr:glycerol-3-phosphate acyltransferase [Anaerolineae bacterium]MBL6966128.1 glycerol-3-phosphate acyltransferase [Anaerolineales bacterium]
MNILLFALFGYLSGSLPFALWVTRTVKGVDIRDGGSGHVTTTNTIRQAGWVWGALVLALDIGKGFLPVYLAAHNGIPDWGIALTAGLAVAGHCWPIFAQFRGGMGLAVTGGSLLAVYPLGFAAALGLLLSLVLVIRHSARGALFTGLMLAPVFWLLKFPSVAIWIGATTGLVIALRFFEDWNRQYRELWLDRE